MEKAIGGGENLRENKLTGEGWSVSPLTMGSSGEGIVGLNVTHRSSVMRQVGISTCIFVQRCDR